MTKQPLETGIRNSNSTVHHYADGLWKDTDQAVEAKRIGPSGNSPYVLPAEVHPAVWAGTWAQQNDAFSEYGAILRDPCVPIKTLFVAISEAKGVSYFETLLAAHQVPGAVHVVPE